MEIFDVSGVLLAGGQSKRMGFPKGNIIFRGQTLAKRAHKILSTTCSEVWISSSIDTYNYLNTPVIPDVFPDAGPLGGIFSALKSASYPQVFFIPLDLPFIDEMHVRYILAASLHLVTPIIPVHPNGKLEPLCGVYPKTILPAVLELLTQRRFKVLDLLDKIGFQELAIKNFPNYHEHLFFNVNTLADAQLLSKF